MIRMNAAIPSVVLVALVACAGEPERVDAQQAFDQLEALVGEWRGTHQWTGTIEGSPGPVVAMASLSCRWEHNSSAGN